MRWFITGATGFAGRALVARARRDGFDVHALVRSGDDAELASAGAHVVRGALGEPEALRVAMEGCDVVVHAAALHEDDAPRGAHGWTNVAGTENVLNAAERARVRRVIHLSCTDVTLSDVDRVHWDEKRALAGAPLGSLARSKLVAEELVVARSTPALECVVLRPAILWGPGDTRFLPDLVKARLEGRPTHVGRGDNLLALTYVEHLADAVARAAAVTAAAGSVYHVTDGDMLEAGAAMDALLRATGLSTGSKGTASYSLARAQAFIRDGMRTDGPRSLAVIRYGRNTRFDSQRAMTALGWEPTSTFEQGVERIARWARELGGPAAVAARRRSTAPTRPLADQPDVGRPP